MTDLVDTDDIDVTGTVAPGFEAVQEAFTRNFADHGEVGAALSVYVDGRQVVDLGGGTTHGPSDSALPRPYDGDTPQVVMSGTKGFTALCANLLADRGLLDVDAPVASYWPEFAAAGKGAIPVRWLLSHQTGLPYVTQALPVTDVLAWDPVVSALAGQAPLWEPGTAHGYHALTFGWLVGELIRRVDGRSVGRFLADEIAAPLGLDLWLGLPAALHDTVAPLTRRPGRFGTPRPEDDLSLVTMIGMIRGADDILVKAIDGVPGMFGDEVVLNQPEVLAGEVPAANGVTTARSLAKLYAATIGPVDGTGPLLSSTQVDAAREVQTRGVDRVINHETSFGLGFMCSCRFSRYGGARGFGHTGGGGSMGFADPEAGIAFGYVMNRVLPHVARTSALVRAVYASAGVTPTYT